MTHLFFQFYRFLSALKRSNPSFLRETTSNQLDAVVTEHGPISTSTTAVLESVEGNQAKSHTPAENYV